MRKTRLIENCRCYHLMSRLVHRAYFLDDDEKSSAVKLLRRVEEFCGVMVLAYAIMSNHFHIFIYVPEPLALEDDEILRRRRRIWVWQCRGSMVWNSNAADLRAVKGQSLLIE